MLTAAFPTVHASWPTGDPDQSIYGWRNANVANLTTRIMSEFGGRVRSVRLGEGYRSTQSILAAAHAIISQGTTPDPAAPHRTAPHRTAPTHFRRSLTRALRRALARSRPCSLAPSHIAPSTRMQIHAGMCRRC